MGVNHWTKGVRYLVLLGVCKFHKSVHVRNNPQVWQHCCQSTGTLKNFPHNSVLPLRQLVFPMAIFGLVIKFSQVEFFYFWNTPYITAHRKCKIGCATLHDCCRHFTELNRYSPNCWQLCQENSNIYRN